MKTSHIATSMHRWSSLRSELLWIYDGVEQSYGETITGDHRQGYWLWLIHKGSVSITCDLGTYTAVAGQWILPPHTLLTQKFVKGSRILSIHFNCQWPTGENLFTGRQGLIWNAKDTPKLERSLVSLQRLTKRHCPGAWLNLYLESVSYPLFMRFQHAFTLFLLEFSEAMIYFGRQFSHYGAHDDRVTLALNCIHATPQNEPFPWGHITKETGLSRKHLDRLFYDHLGTTSRNYWEKIKLEEGMRLLEATTLSIKEVGYRLGFKQASHFSTWFARHSHRTPSEHRKHGIHSSVMGLVGNTQEMQGQRSGRA
jgi:AraC-like DNA-binding protein